VTEPYERLDEALEERRVDLDLTWRELADAARMSEPALRAIRRGTYAPSTRTRRRLERAIGWQQGSIDAVLAGGEPTTVDPLEALNDDELRLLREAIARAVAELGDAKDERQRERLEAEVTRRFCDNQHP
jgi:transcriptional regulator with XRE-family HTH domain